MDLLSVSGLVNYFGRTSNVDDITISPLLMRKGRTKLALYGLGSIRDERLHRTFLKKNVSPFLFCFNDCQVCTVELCSGPSSKRKIACVLFFSPCFLLLLLLSPSIRSSMDELSVLSEAHFVLGNFCICCDVFYPIIATPPPPLSVMWPFCCLFCVWTPACVPAMSR